MRNLSEIARELHDKCDNDTYCPRCGRSLTRLHMQSACYTTFIIKTAQRTQRQEEREEKLKEKKEIKGL